MHNNGCSYKNKKIKKREILTNQLQSVQSPNYLGRTPLCPGERRKTPVFGAHASIPPAAAASQLGSHSPPVSSLTQLLNFRAEFRVRKAQPLVLHGAMLHYTA
jgi:hypothetical protein